MTRIIFLYLFSAFTIGSSLFLSACSLFESQNPKSREPDLSGGGIRTTNGEVLGRVKFADASPAEGRQIHLYKIFLSATPDSFQAEWAGISDSVGSYQFQKIPAGKFVMTVKDVNAGEIAIMPRLIKGEEGFFVLDALLAPWVTLVGRVLPPEGQKPMQIKVCIPGIPNCVVPGPDSVFVFPRAPQGEYDLVYLQDSVANYLSVQVTKGKSDTLYVKDVKIDLSIIGSANSNRNFSFYPSATKHSVYVVPVPYTLKTLPGWFEGKSFEGIRYFVAVEDKQFEQHDIEDYLDWNNSMVVKMPLYSPADASTRLTLDFPFLLRLDKSNFDFSQAKGNGQDFRVSRTNGRHLPYFIEHWDSAGGSAEIWTRIDTLLANNSGQSLSYYWGNANATDQSFKGALLSRQANERIVWPMDENAKTSLVSDLGGSFPGYFTKIGIGKGETTNNSITGLIFNALSLNGVNDVITIDPHPLLNFPNFTLSIWAKNESPNIAVRQHIIQKADIANGRREWYLALDPSQSLRFGVGGKNGQWSGAKITVKPIPNPSLWHQFAVTFSAGEVQIYVDGVEFKTTEMGTLPAVIPDLGSGITLGVPSSNIGTYWKGQVDHLFYDRQVRPAAWIKSVYENEKR